MEPIKLKAVLQRFGLGRRVYVNSARPHVTDEWSFDDERCLSVGPDTVEMN